jgi:hypothetical protein
VNRPEACFELYHPEGDSYGPDSRNGFETDERQKEGG